MRRRRVAGGGGLDKTGRLECGGGVHVSEVGWERVQEAGSNVTKGSAPPIVERQAGGTKVND